MIGKIYICVTPFTTLNNRGFKKRPVLIIGKADKSDYIALPVSRVTNTQNLDIQYDIPISPTSVPLMNLSQLSYIRTHKQFVINATNLVKCVVDFKKEYSNLYIEVLVQTEQFQKNIISNAF